MEQHMKEIAQYMEIFSQINDLRCQGIRIGKKQGRTIVEAFIEGRKGHYLLCPERINSRSFCLISNSLDVELHDGTTAVAQLTLQYEGRLSWIWKIEWERDSTYNEW